jgi:spermidine synthase
MSERNISTDGTPGPDPGPGAGGVWRYLLFWFLLGAGSLSGLRLLVDLAELATGATSLGRSASLTAVFLALAAGISLARGISARSGAPALLLAAGWVAVFPVLVRLLEAAGGMVSALAEGRSWLLLLLRLPLALAGLGAPAFCLGLAFGLASRAASRDTGRDPRPEALRLALMAAGGAFATVLGIFRLRPWAGPAGEAYLAAGLILLAGLLLFPLLRGESDPIRTAGAPRGLPGGALGWVWGFTAVSAVAGWGRLGEVVFGPLSEASGSAYSLFLGSAAVGLLLSALRRPGPESRFPRTGGIAWAAGLAILAGAYLSAEGPLLLLAIHRWSPPPSFGYFAGAWGVAKLFVVPAGFLLGLLWASGLRAAETQRDDPGTGDPLTGISRAAGGAALAGLLLPHLLGLFGFRAVLAGSGALLVALGSLRIGLDPERGRMLRAAALLVGLAVPAGLAAFPDRAAPRLLATGVHRYAREILTRFGTAAEYVESRKRSPLGFYREGREGTVAVERQEGASSEPLLALSLDGVVVGTSLVDRIPQILSAQIPLLLRPGAGRMLLLGYGTGIAAGSALSHPLESLDVAEPEPALVEASRRFEPGNGAPRNDPRVRILADDPRLVLRSARGGTYDVILSCPAAPEAAPARHLATRSFYALAASRLKPGGIFAQCVTHEGLLPAELAVLLQTIRGAFADTVYFQTYYQEGLVVASGEAIRLDPDAMRRAMQAAPVAESLARAGIREPEPILTRHRLSGKGLEAFCGAARVVEDAGPPLAWTGYRTSERPLLSETLEAIDRFSTGLPGRIEGVAEGKEGDAKLLAIARVALGMGDAVRAADLAEALLARGNAADGHQILGDAHLLRREQIPAV